MKAKSIHELNIRDFDDNPIWRIVDYDVEGGVDVLVEPINSEEDLDEEEYYIRIRWEFSDKTSGYGIGTIDPISDELNSSSYSYFINDDWHYFFMPPAPDFVLEKEGPRMFASRVGKKITDIYPLTVTASIVMNGYKREYKEVISLPSNF